MLAVHCSGSGKADLGWRVLHLDLRGVKFMSPMVLRGFLRFERTEHGENESDTERKTSEVWHTLNMNVEARFSADVPNKLYTLVRTPNCWLEG